MVLHLDGELCAYHLHILISSEGHCFPDSQPHQPCETLLYLAKLMFSENKASSFAIHSHPPSPQKKSSLVFCHIFAMW